MVTEPVHKVWKALNILRDPEARNDHISENLFGSKLEGIATSIKPIKL